MLVLGICVRFSAFDVGFIHKSYNREHTGQWSVASLKSTEVNLLRSTGDYVAVYNLEVIDSLHLGPRPLWCAALTFNVDGLVPHAY